MRTGPLDLAPLRAPIDRAALRDFRRALPRGVLPGRSPSILLGVIAVLVVAPFPVAQVLIAERVERMDVTVLEITATGFLVLVPAGCVAGIVVLARLRSGRRQFRLDALARANGFVYRPLVTAPHWRGFILGHGVTRDLLERGDALRIGNHRVPGGRNRGEQRWGVVELRLPVELPHIVLDARANGSLRRAGLPIDLDPDQRLRLEGDFDRHFALFCPTGYEADALYLFTPDVMARFIDTAAALDVEIVDDRLLLIARRDLATLDAETWRWLGSVIDALQEKVERWSRWRDDRLAGEAAGLGAALIRPPRGVAPQGRRLALRSGWFWGVVGLLLSVFGWWSIVADLLESLGWR